jgi:hypothetical protein
MMNNMIKLAVFTELVEYLFLEHGVNPHEIATEEEAKKMVDVVEKEFEKSGLSPEGYDKLAVQQLKTYAKRLKKEMLA